MYLTHWEFVARVKKLNSGYWNEGAPYRWEYMSYVIDMLKIMGAEKIIEAGASNMPLKSDSFRFDYPAYDLNKPFPADVKPGFDAFVALQVWEHLDNQADAFREVMRVSSGAVLSFPYKWRHGDARHKGIDKAIIKQWTCGVEPVHIQEIKNRIVYVWRF